MSRSSPAAQAARMPDAELFAYLLAHVPGPLGDAVGSEAIARKAGITIPAASAVREIRHTMNNPDEHPAVRALAEHFYKGTLSNPEATDADVITARNRVRARRRYEAEKVTA